MSDDELEHPHAPVPPTTESKSIIQSLRENDDIITSEVSSEAGRPSEPDLQARQRLARIPPDTLGLFPGDSQEPILYAGPEKMVLGRASLPQTSAVIDLTPFDAIDLGVSRRHAAISVAGPQYLIEDLGSMNGTWLHEARLPIFVERALESGDVIRLGQLEITVYFHPRSSTTPQLIRTDPPLRQVRTTPDTSLILLAGAEEMIFVVEKTSLTVEERLTIDFMAAYILPYLQMIEQLQRLLDEMQGKARRSLIILQVRSTPRLSASISGASEAIKLARTVIVQWRQKHIVDVQKLIEARARQMPPHLSHERMVSMEVSEAELTADILTMFGSQLQPADLAVYARQLIEPVKGLIYSPLSLLPEDE